MDLLPSQIASLNLVSYDPRIALNGVEGVQAEAKRCTAFDIYLGVTGFVAWRILSGDPHLFLKNYTLGTNAAWVTLGFMLWVVTE